MDIPPPPPPPSLETRPAAEAGSVFGRMANMIAAPGEVFDSLQGRDPATSNWLAPLILNILATLVFSFIVFSQPGVTQEMRQQQEAQMAKQVAAGKMTAQQAAQANEQMAKMSDLFVYFALAGSVFAPPAFLFIGAVVIWLAGVMICRGDYGYARALEITGLASVINVVGAAITLPLIIIKGSASAAPSLALLAPSAKPGTPLFTALSMVNAAYLWWIAVLALGISTLGDRKYGKALGALLAVYALIGAAFVGMTFLNS